MSASNIDVLPGYDYVTFTFNNGNEGDLVYCTLIVDTGASQTQLSPKQAQLGLNSANSAVAFSMTGSSSYLEDKKATLTLTNIDYSTDYYAYCVAQNG